MAIRLAAAEPLTVAALAQLPDDGRRYELVDGTLLVTPAPGARHQSCVVNLAVLLHGALPADLKVLVAPYDWQIHETTLVQPDLLVARRADFGERGLTSAPLLVVEVLSPSTRRFDLGPKRDLFEEQGVRTYWVVDPDAPSVTVHHRRSGRLAAGAPVAGDAEVIVEDPCRLRFSPAQLLR